MDSVAPAFCAFPDLSGSGIQGLGSTLLGCGATFPSAARPRQPEAWAHSPQMRVTFSLCGEAQAARVLGALSWMKCAFSLCSPSGRHWLGACGLRLFRGVGEELASSRDPPLADVDHPESQEFFR